MIVCIIHDLKVMGSVIDASEPRAVATLVERRSKTSLKCPVPRLAQNTCFMNCNLVGWLFNFTFSDISAI